MTQRLVKEAFPHGAAAYFGEDRPVLDLIGRRLAEHEGKTYMRGWAYPSKDFVFDVTEPEETDSGWRVRTLEGAKVFLSPLSADRGKQAADAVRES